ncbi:MAG: hypothetical protein KF878_36925, partial [Planctomycetes bacterium]|nr:hypothetical protein [Planctomycetota bacterium]
GALPRGLVVLAALPLLAAAVVVAARGDRTLSPWSVELVALLVVGVLAAAAGFLFGVDLPRARRVQLVLERTSALPGALVLRARATGAVLGALPALVAAAAAVAVDPDPARAGLAGAVLLKGLVLVVCVAHDAAGYGLRGECAGDPALATGYPLRVAPLVGVLAFGLLFHVLLGALYLLFGWHGEAARSARRWELDEVQPERAQAA